MPGSSPSSEIANRASPSTHLKGVRKPWVKALKDAGISYFPIYNLRATFASRLSAAGAPSHPASVLKNTDSVDR